LCAIAWALGVGPGSEAGGGRRAVARRAGGGGGIATARDS
jgi:hypothetical protein